MNTKEIKEYAIYITVVAVIVIIGLMTYHKETPRKYKKTLVEIDALCESQPQEALKRLKAMSHEDFYMDDSDTWFYKLLLAKANHSNQATYEYVDSVLNVAQYYKDQYTQAENQNYWILTALYICLAMMIPSAAFLLVYMRKSTDEEVGQRLRLQYFREQAKRESESYIAQCESKIKELEEEISATKNDDPEYAEKIKMQQNTFIYWTDIVRKKRALASNVSNQIMKSDSYRTIIMRADNDEPLTETDLIRLEQTMNDVLPTFKQNIYAICPISKLNYHILSIMRISNVSSTKIATLLCREKSTISKAQKKLREKLLGKDCSKEDFDKFIRSL